MMLLFRRIRDRERKTLLAVGVRSVFALDPASLPLEKLPQRIPCSSCKTRVTAAFTNMVIRGKLAADLVTLCVAVCVFVCVWGGWSKLKRW